MTQPVAHSLHLDQALAVYLEPHAEGRRVLLLGEAEGVLAARLSRVAERLEIIDPEHRVASEAGVPDLPFRDAVFDLVIVADIALLPEPMPDAVRELRRVARDEGVLLLAMTPDEGGRRRRGAPQDALSRLLSAEFRFARVIEQGPVSGYAFSALDGERNEEISIDSSLVGSSHRQPLRYLALGSDMRVGLESRLWVQVPEREGAATGAGPDRALLGELQKAEEAARAALQRESELLRELEAERKAHAQTERGVVRAEQLERKLLEIEADYDDAVGRVRFLENELSEREASRDRDRVQRKELERELTQLRQALSSADAKRKKAEQNQEHAQGELQALQEERTALEERLKEAAGQILALGRDIKHQQTVGKDLLEELRRREEIGQVTVVDEARLSALEAERARAVERVLEAELARESATLRADELRAQLHAALESALRAESRAAEQVRVPEILAAKPAVSAELTLELAEARGEASGLRFRVAEAERALSVQRERARALSLTQASSEGPALEENARLHDMLDQAQDRIEELEDALARAQDRSEADRTVELEAELDRMDHRVRELTRDLEEADRLAESHAEDAERLEAMDVELEAARRRLDSLDDELRSTQDELRAARSDAEALVIDTATRVELSQQKAAEARAERDDARVALSEARAILAQLAGSAGDAARDVSSVPVSEAEGPAEAQLRSELAERNARLLDVERELAERAQRILQLEENLRAQIRGSVPPPPFGSSDA